MISIMLAGCAGFIRATGKGIDPSSLLPPQRPAPSQEAFPIQSGPVKYTEIPTRAIGTYDLIQGNVVRDIVLNDNPAPVISQLITQELEQKGIKNRPSDLMWSAVVTSLYVNGDRGSPQVYSGGVSIDLTVHDLRTGTQVWSRKYSGWGTSGDPQSALASAFRNMAGSIGSDNSILALRKTSVAAKTKKPLEDPLAISKAEIPQPAFIPAPVTPPPPPVKPPEPKTAVKADRKPPSITITSPEVKRGVRLTIREESVTVRGVAKDESGVASVTVNGQAASLDENGNFAAEVRLKMGDNKIYVTATDTRKNTARETFTLARRAARSDQAKKPAAPAPPMSAAAASGLSGGKYYGYVIGINRYRHLPKLRTAVNDANAVAEVLRDNYGFEVETILDGQATRDNIIRGLNTLRRKLTAADSLLIYYAGHGDHNKETDTAYWLPVDAEKGDTTNWVDAKSVTDLLKLTSARHVLIVADSCYSGTLTRKAATDISGGQTRDAYLRKLLAKTSRVLIASGGNEPVSDSGGGEHSVFAAVFIRALQNPDKIVFTAEELHTNAIKEAVAGRSEQTPEYRIIRASGHDGGDFIFIKTR